jgi:hypothetical protein
VRGSILILARKFTNNFFSGGSNSLFYRKNDFRRELLGKLRKAIRSLLKQIAQHEAWISNPYLKFAVNAHPAIIRYHQLVKWRNDIARQREQINILEGVIHERERQK